MLQTATNVLNSAFKDSFIKKLAMYLHDCVSEEVRSCAFKNLRQDKANKWVFLENTDMLAINPDKPLKISSTNSANGEITGLMMQADASPKDYQLIYGFLFLKGKSSENRKNEDYLTPLLYIPCKLEKDKLEVNCRLLDDYLSLNTSALVSLMEFDEEDETAEHLLEGLMDYIPEMPLNAEKMQVFLNVLKAIIPDIEVTHLFDQAVSAEDLLADTLENLTVVNASAIILTKRPNLLAGLLHELSEISEKQAGVFRETALAPILDEFSGAVKNKKLRKSPIKRTKRL